MTQYYNPPKTSAVSPRQFLSIPIAILLYTAAVPFTPVAWVVGAIDGAYLCDRFVAGLILLIAMYFQWQVAGLTYPVNVINPIAEKRETYIVNGKVGIRRESGDHSDILFIYNPANFMTYAGIEVVALLVAEFGGSEYLRRGLVVGVLAALWALGWTITPRSMKQWAWGHIKVFWFFIVYDIIRDIGFGGGRSTRRSRR